MPPPYLPGFYRTIASQTYLGRELVRSFQDSTPIIWVGAGLSASLTGNHPTSTWPGLVDAMVSRCRNLGLFSDEEAVRQMNGRRAGVASLLAVATACERVLKNAGEWERFWHDFEQGLPLVDPALAHAIDALRCPVISTNYDTAFERATGRTSVSWNHPEQVERALRGDVRDVIHVHGTVAEPHGIVFGNDGYRRYMADERAMATLKAIQVLRPHVYICLGEGLDDPFFTKHLEWLRTWFRSSSVRHFRLCLDSEVDVLRRHHADDNVAVVAYGTRYADLAPFLRRCVQSRAPHGSRGRLVAAVALAAGWALAVPGDASRVDTIEITGQLVAGNRPIPYARLEWPGTNEPWPVGSNGDFKGLIRDAMGGPVAVQLGEHQFVFDVRIPELTRKARVTLDLQTGRVVINPR